MEITVTVEEDDVVALNDHVATTVPAVRGQIRFARIVGPTMLMVGGGLLMLLRRRPVGMAFLIAGAVLLVFYPWLIASARRRGVRRMLATGSNVSVFGPQTLTINPDELLRHNEYGYSATYWRAIDRIEVGPLHAFVFTSSMTAIIIPKRELTQAVFERFIERSEEYLAEAKRAE